MNILVTGGCGFIGSTLIKTLLKNKNNLILNIDSLSKHSVPEALIEVKNYKNYRFKKINICNYTLLKKVIFKFKPIKIFHLAAESHVDRSIKNPTNFINSNILGTFNLLNIFKEYLEQKRLFKKKYIFIHVSTDEVYGSLTKHQPPSSEKSKYLPNSPYSASKASSDFLVRAWNATYNLPVIITHCSNNYGSWQLPEKLIPLVIYKAYTNQKIPIYGNGLNIRDWIFVEDHVRILIEISRKGSKGEIYNIGARQEIKNINLVKEVCKILDRKIPKKNKHNKLINFVKDRLGHDYRYSLSTKKIENEFNFKPKNKFILNLEKTVDWYLVNIKWLKNKYKKIQ